MYNVRSVLLLMCLFLTSCAINKSGFHYDEKNPIQTYIGMVDAEFESNSSIRFYIVERKNLNEYFAKYSRTGQLVSVGEKTGKSQWIGSSYFGRHDMELKWTLNPELNKSVRSSGLIDIGDDLLKARAKGEIILVCQTCTDSGQGVHKEYKFKKTVGEYKTQFAEQKKRVEQDKREYEKMRAQLKKDAEINSKKVAVEGDKSTDDLTCKKFGFKPQTNGYSECRLKLEIASRQATQQQSLYEEQQRIYVEQQAAIKKERDRQRAMKSLEMGLRMMGGQSAQDAAMATSGMQPMPKPQAPGPINQTIVMPGGRIVNCSTTGSITNCY